MRIGRRVKIGNRYGEFLGSIRRGLVVVNRFRFPDGEIAEYTAAALSHADPDVRRRRNRRAHERAQIRRAFGELASSIAKSDLDPTWRDIFLRLSVARAEFECARVR